jgi:hypothetical protein
MAMIVANDAYGSDAITTNRPPSVGALRGALAPKLSHSAAAAR